MPSSHPPMAPEERRPAKLAKPPSATASQAARTSLALDDLFGAKPRHLDRVSSASGPRGAAAPAKLGTHRAPDAARDEPDDDAWGPRLGGSEEAGIGFRHGGRKEGAAGAGSGAGGSRGKLETLRGRLLGKRKAGDDGAGARSGARKPAEESEDDETGRSGLGRRKRERPPSGAEVGGRTEGDETVWSPEGGEGPAEDKGRDGDDDEVGLDAGLAVSGDQATETLGRELSHPVRGDGATKSKRRKKDRAKKAKKRQKSAS